MGVSLTNCYNKNVTLEDVIDPNQPQSKAERPEEKKLILRSNPKR